MILMIFQFFPKMVQEQHTEVDNVIMMYYIRLVNTFYK